MSFMFQIHVACRNIPTVHVLLVYELYRSPGSDDLGGVICLVLLGMGETKGHPSVSSFRLPVSITEVNDDHEPS